MPHQSILSIPFNEHIPPVRNQQSALTQLPKAQKTKLHPKTPGDENAFLFFVGTATTIIEWAGLRIMTDPNFLHAGDHVHLGPGVTSKRVTDPAIDIEELPPIDIVLLSHYHADHFDQEVEEKLRRDLPIITTPHARQCLVDQKSESERFTNVSAVDFWDSCLIKCVGPEVRGTSGHTAVKVVGMPGKHVPPGPLDVANEILHAVPPTNGWMVELGNLEEVEDPSSFKSGYRIYISGDTLLVDELKEIPQRYRDQNIDLMLMHLGGTTIPSPSMPLLMVTMDAKQGVQLMQLVQPDITIPIHYDDYEVFLSPLEDFKKAVEEVGLGDKVVYLDRKDEYRFLVKSNQQA